MNKDRRVKETMPCLTYEGIDRNIEIFINRRYDVYIVEQNFSRKEGVGIVRDYMWF
jgi:hypothetical protein